MISILLGIVFLFNYVESYDLKTNIDKSITPLMYAAKKNDINYINNLLRTKIDINEHSANKMTALHYALTNKNEEAAILLLEKGSDINAMDIWQNTPLSLARLKKLDKVISLIEKKFINGNHFYQDFNNSDKHFVLLIASYNNKKWYKRNLDAAFSQNYKKYTIIYMDDVSNDNTGKLVQEYVKDKYSDRASQFILIQNNSKKYCLGNYLFAIEKFCPNDSILITYDGDDWFANNNVLSYLNNIYKDTNIWLTYGNCLEFPLYRKCSYCLPLNSLLIRNNRLRQKFLKEERWSIHHLRSFYTWLFRKIKYQDLLDEHNSLFKYTEDVAFMLPMLEMSGERAKYLHEVLYIYNRSNSLNTPNVFGHKKLKKAFSFICNKEKYQQLKGYNEK